MVHTRAVWVAWPVKMGCQLICIVRAEQSNCCIIWTFICDWFSSVGVCASETMKGGRESVVPESQCLSGVRATPPLCSWLSFPARASPLNQSLIPEPVTATAPLKSSDLWAQIVCQWLLLTWVQSLSHHWVITTNRIVKCMLVVEDGRWLADSPLMSEWPHLRVAFKMKNTRACSLYIPNN